MSWTIEEITTVPSNSYEILLSQAVLSPHVIEERERILEEAFPSDTPDLVSREVIYIHTLEGDVIPLGYFQFVNGWSAANLSPNVVLQFREEEVRQLPLPFQNLVSEEMPFQGRMGPAGVISIRRSVYQIGRIESAIDITRSWCGRALDAIRGFGGMIGRGIASGSRLIFSAGREMLRSPRTLTLAGTGILFSAFLWESDHRISAAITHIASGILAGMDYEYQLGNGEG